MSEQERRQAQALALREQGLKWREVAERLGVSLAVARRWAYPEEAEQARVTSAAWRDRNRVKRREYDRQYKLRKRLGEVHSGRRPEMPYDRFLRELRQGVRT